MIINVNLTLLHLNFLNFLNFLTLEIRNMGLILSKATYKSSENHEKKIKSITKKQNQRGTIPAQTKL